MCILRLLSSVTWFTEIECDANGTLVEWLATKYFEGKKPSGVYYA